LSGSLDRPDGVGCESEGGVPRTEGTVSASEYR
jgi:hypothetical protein